ncbi:hypothetical protein [Carboxylicivirga linearis]|uniref:Uncharacterized protein n=1 Tax=Carboxylicivirga linearis TaxID=1628157 RepID=A0ABS5K1V4_9BACT|nr:hypothetical protein [Carboxylicivirga linearis]MBS2101114.1 hypothetical protein [Carboxylicivirga linearis]
MKNNKFYSFSLEGIYTFKVYGDLMAINSHELKVEAFDSVKTNGFGQVYSFYKRFKDQSHLFSFLEKIYDLHLTILSIEKITESEINKLIV